MELFEVSIFVIMLRLLNNFINSLNSPLYYNLLDQVSFIDIYIPMPTVHFGKDKYT